MAFKQTQWELSDITVDPDAENNFIDPEPGLQYLVIKDAQFTAENARYKITFESLTNSAEVRVTYFFADKNDVNVPPACTNKKQMGCVASLGKALAGVNINIPAPQDIIGGVVMADVQVDEVEKDGKIRKYPKIWKYEPVPKEIALSYSDIEQYYTEEEEEASE